MEVEVLRNPSAGSLPEIHPEVQTIWTVRLPDRELHPPRPLHHLPGYLPVQSRQ